MPKHKIRNVMVPVLLCLVAGSAGFGLGRMQSSRAEQPVPTLEYFLPPPTFSEIENAKGVLEAAASRLIMQVRLARRAGSSSVNSNHRNRHLSPDEAISVLEEGLKEFKGTEAEFRLIQELLILLQKEQRHGEWLNLYLDTLRRRPGHELIQTGAERAAGIASAIGREHELAAGLRALESLAVKPPVKSRLRKALANVEGERQFFTKHESNPCPL